jgi:hypothetical protein
MQSITWNDGKAVIPKIEFYINNTCNLTCDNCNRFNNHHFTGWQKFEDYESDLKKWAECIDIEHIVIMGGEPLLNPSIVSWIKGLSDIWHKSIQILTNGTRLNNVKGLYQAVYKPEEKMITNWIGISWHNLEDNFLFQEIENFLQPPIRSYGTAKMGQELIFVDKNEVPVKVYVQNEFGKAAIFRNEQGRFTLHQSQPEAAHSTCSFHLTKSYHMIHGKLYKCGPVALFPEFDQQHDLDLSSEDKQLINDYKPLCVDDFPTKGQQFLDSIDNVLPQCKFCPIGWKHNPEIIFPTIKNKNTI